MFDLKRPCVNCPIRVSQGPLFGMSAARLREIVNGVAFQCHKTVNYNADEEDREARSGNKPQQCAGLMTLLHKVGQPNQIMRVAERLTGFDASLIDDDDVYPTIEALMDGHAKGRRMCRE